MGLHFWLLEDLGGKAASCEEASSIKLLQVKMKMRRRALMVANKMMTTTSAEAGSGCNVMRTLEWRSHS